MRIAIFSDIHANREALEACLEAAARLSPDRALFLGDIVGYGADPQWCVETVMARPGAIVLRGNHDQAIGDPSERMNQDGTAAIAWTQSVLSNEAKDWLAQLPLTAEEEDRLYVHADASEPWRFRYVTDEDSAQRSLDGTQQRITLCGHVHIPRLFGRTATGRITVFRPVSGIAVPLPAPRKWLAVLGAVGQPRDRNPAACFGLLDTAAGTLAWHRVAYDIEAAAAKIRAAGLPDRLASRLASGW